MTEEPQDEQEDSLAELPTEEAVALLVTTFGESEASARWLVAFAKGETGGDVRAVPEPTRRRRLRISG